MKETKELETLLHSWAPRRPSATLSAKLFPQTTEEPLPNLRLSWLVPATAVFLLLFSLFNQPSDHRDRKSTRLNSSHSQISYAVFCLKKKNHHRPAQPAYPRGPAPTARFDEPQFADRADAVTRDFYPTQPVNLCLILPQEPAPLLSLH